MDTTLFCRALFCQSDLCKQTIFPRSDWFVCNTAVYAMCIWEFCCVYAMQENKTKSLHSTTCSKYRGPKQDDCIDLINVNLHRPFIIQLHFWPIWPLALYESAIVATGLCQPLIEFKHTSLLCWEVAVYNDIDFLHRLAQRFCFYIFVFSCSISPYEFCRNGHCTHAHTKIFGCVYFQLFHYLIHLIERRGHCAKQSHYLLLKFC